MITQKEYTCKNGTKMIRTYSSKKCYIIQRETGIKYAEAYDIPNRYTYVETDEKIVDDINNENQ